MKVLVTLDFPPETGGIQRYLWEIVRHTFVSEDCVLVGTRVVTVMNTDMLPCSVVYFSTPFSRFNKKISLLKLIFPLIKLIRKRNSDQIFYAGNIYAAIPLYALSFIFRISFSIYCHGGELLVLKRYGVRSFLFRQIMKRALNLFYVSQYTAEILWNHVSTNKLVHVPPKIDLCTIQAPLKSPKESVQLLSVGRLVKHKGHSTLINALHFIPPEIIWNLTIAGNGPELLNLKTQIATSHFKERIQIRTSLTDSELSEEYRKADIFLFPSLETEGATEGFGVVLLEAMAYNIPVIASRIGGVPEVLGNGLFGLLVNPGDEEGIAAAMITLINDDALRMQIIDKAAKHVRSTYAW